MAEHLKTGASGEDAAAEHLKARGYEILDRNWTSGRLELDIVARKDGCVVFVEVKTRSSARHGLPAQAVGPKKAERLLAAARLYMSEHDLWDTPCRMDVVAVIKTAAGYELEHIQDALGLSDPVAGGHAAWQPW